MRVKSERGIILTIAVAMAVLGAIASMTVLQVAFYQARHARFYRLHSAARYAAEAGVIWAQQQLIFNPGYCGAPDPPPAMFNPPATVDVTVTNCGAGLNHAVTARVIY